MTPKATHIAPIAVKYNIAPSTTVDDILDELHCLLESAQMALEASSGILDKIPGGWSALYALRQSIGLLDALGDRLPEAEVLEAMRNTTAQ